MSLQGQCSHGPTVPAGQAREAIPKQEKIAYLPTPQVQVVARNPSRNKLM